MRRCIVLCVGLTLLLLPAVLFAGGQAEEGDEGVNEIVVAINDAPWLPGYEAIAEMYEEETGVAIDLRVFPFGQLTERARSATEAESSEFDVITMNTSGTPQFYDGGLVAPLTEIDPDFEVDPNMIGYFDTMRWDQEAGTNTPDGEIYGLPINGNIQIFYYRSDLYEEAGLDPPETWEDVMEASNELADPDDGFYGYAVRGQRGTLSVSWDFYPFLKGHGGSIFADPPDDWSVVLNSEEGLEALETYLELAREHSPPDAANIGQAEQIAMLQSDRLLQTIAVSGAFHHMDNPDQSAVTGDIEYTVLPRPVDGEHRANIGELIQGIPHNLPEERQQAALHFLEYLTSFDSQVEFARHGGVPVRSDVYEDSEIADEEEFRYFEASKESEQYLVGFPRIPETIQYTDVLELRINQAISGDLTAEEALETAAEEIYEILDDAGYDTSYTPNFED